MPITGVTRECLEIPWFQDRVEEYLDPIWWEERGHQRDWHWFLVFLMDDTWDFMDWVDTIWDNDD